MVECYYMSYSYFYAQLSNCIYVFVEHGQLMNLYFLLYVNFRI
jgi:hypothetical protein